MDDQPIKHGDDSASPEQKPVGPIDLTRRLAVWDRLEQSLSATSARGAFYANPRVMEMAANLRRIQEGLPKINAAFDAVAPPVAKSIAEALAASERIKSHFPKFAPEFVDMLSRLDAMTAKVAVSPSLLNFYTRIKQNRGLFDAARAAAFAPPPGRAVFDHIRANQWPVMSSFRYQDEDMLVADIDLGEMADTPEEKPSGILLSESEKIKRIITDIYHDNNALLRLGSRNFEEVIAELLRSQGFTVELTKQTRDGGRDLIALSRTQIGSPLKFLVECKRYTADKIGIEVIRQLMYVVHQEDANKGIIAATNYFTSDAKKHQQRFHYYSLDLRDKNDVLQWIRQYGEEHLQLRNDKS